MGGSAFGALLLVLVLAFLRVATLAGGGLLLGLLLALLAVLRLLRLLLLLLLQQLFHQRLVLQRRLQVRFTLEG